MAIILARNGKSLKGISSPRRRNESLSNWDSKTPPPPGYGLIYVIHHYVEGRDYGTYIGLTRRACYKRWAEHVTEGQSYLRLGPRVNKKSSTKRKNKSYQYLSATNKPLHSAIAIAIGRQIQEDFSSRFSFHVLGCYSLFTLDNVEATLISNYVSAGVAGPRSFREIRSHIGLNSKNESKKIPGASFKASGYYGDKSVEPTAIDFTLRVLALEAYINYESENDSNVPSYLKERPKTPDDLYLKMSRYFLEDGAEFAPAKLRSNPTKLKDAIVQILDIKIKGGSYSYLIFQGFATASLSRLRIITNTYFGSASGRGVGKGSKSVALGRLGTFNPNDRDEYLIPKDQKDRVFTKKGDVSEEVFKIIAQASSMQTSKSVVLDKAVVLLKKLQVEIAELVAKSIEAGGNINKVNSIQKELAKKYDKYNATVRSFNFREEIEFIVVRNKDAE
jgi:hypothetical protein